MKIKTKQLDRLMGVVEGSVNKELREATFTCSSEYPVERVFWTEEGPMEGFEVLIHTPDAADLSRLNGGSLRNEHWGPQIGGTKNATLTAEKKAQVTARYSRDPGVEPVWQDVLDDIRKNVSIRYQPRKIVRTEKTIEGKPVFEVRKWEAIHVAHVADPADPTVGHGRSSDDENKEFEVEYEDRSLSALPTPQKQTRSKSMDPNEREVLEAQIRAEEAKKRDEAVKEARTREAELSAYVEKYGHVKGVADAVREGREKNLALHEVGRKVLELTNEKREVAKTYAPEDQLGMGTKEVKQYSLIRAALMTLPGAKQEGIEYEAHRALLDKGATQREGGILIPFDVMGRKSEALARASQRDQTAATNSAGGYLVQNQALSMIELLRNRQVMDKLGVQRLSGLRGRVYMPRQTGALTAYWVAEDAATTESALTFGQITMDMKTVSGLAEMSRNLMMQSDPSIEGMVMNDLSKVLGLATDLACISGSGTSAQPLGFLNVSGIGTFTGASLSWVYVNSALTDVSVANADEGSLKWLGTPAVREICMTREKSTGYPVFLMNEDQKMLGYPFFASNQMSSATLAFGDFSTCVLGEWCGLEIKARDSIANPNTGNVEVIAFYSTDFAVRQPTALTVATSTT